MTFTKIGVRAKFIIIIGILLSTVFASMTVFLARRDATVLRESLYNEARAFATLATDPLGTIFVLYKDSGTLNVDSAIATYTKLNSNITDVALIDLNGTVVYSQNSQKTKTYPSSLAQSFEPVYINNSQGTLETIIYPFKEANGARRYSLVYSISSTSINKSVKRVLIFTIVFSTVWLVITLSLLYVVVNQMMIQKIRRISAQAKLISEGHFDHTVTLDSHDELGDLARSVNLMANALKQDIEKLRQLDEAKSEFMMITSHNLRTPLAVIDGYIESTAYFKSIDEFKTAIKEIAHGSKRLNVFAEDVLTISQLEMGEKLQAPTDIQINDFVQSISKDFDELSKLKGVQFSAHISQGERTVQISKPYMRAAIWNLLDNALKFTEKGGSIELRLTHDESQISIDVVDTGIGIGDDEKSKLFTKFHRSTDTLAYNYEGTGIGLYATKMIVERHHGTVSCVSSEGEGSTFTITLPLKS